MRFRILIVIAISLFLTNCSTGPDFERDSFYDPEANTPNARFLYPSPENDQNYRGAHEFNSFIIQVNAAVINKDVTLSLVSDKDGELFSTNNITSDTLKIDYTLLSRDEHEITLFLDKRKTDKVSTTVNLPDQVKLFEPTWDDSGYKIKWSSYPESDFEKYSLNILLNDGSIETLEQFSNKNDTVYIDYYYPIEKSYKYFITTTSNKYLGSRSSEFKLIEPSLMPLSDEHNLREEYYIASNLINFDDEIFLYYVTRENGIYIASRYSVTTNQIYQKSIGIDKVEKLYIHSHSSGPKIFLSIDNYLHQVDPIDFSIISSHDLSSKAFENQDNPETPVTDILYDDLTKTYFVIFGTSPHGPYSFDHDFKYINSHEVESIRTFLGKNDNALLAKTSWSPNTVYSYSYNESGIIENKTSNPTRIPVTGSFSEISEKHNKIFFGSGHIFSADLNLNYHGSLPDIDGFYTDYAIDESNQDTLLASSSEGSLYKIFIPDNEIISVQNFKYKVMKIFLINGQKYLLQTDNDRLNPLYKLTFIP